MFVIGQRKHLFGGMWFDWSTKTHLFFGEMWFDLSDDRRATIDDFTYGVTSRLVLPYSRLTFGKVVSKERVELLQIPPMLGEFSIFQNYKTKKNKKNVEYQGSESKKIFRRKNKNEK